MKRANVLRLTLLILFVSSIILLTSCGKTYTVSFNVLGGTEVPSQEVEAGAFAKEPPSPVKDGYTFGGWYQNNDKWSFTHYAIGKDITLTAKWIPNYTVEFMPQNGQESSAQTLSGGSSVPKPQAPKRDGFEFLGWYSGDILWDFSTMQIKSNLTLVAKWRQIFTVSFNSDGGTAVLPQSVKDGDTATAPPEILKSGHIFAGWHLPNNTLFDFSTPISADTVLTAVWKRQYAVYFDTDGGEALDPVYVIEGNSVPIPAEITKSGYVFDYWYNSAGDASTPYDFASLTVTSDLHLKASWRRIYNVSFDSFGGSTVESVRVPDGQTLSAPTPPTREFYLFDTWLDENGNPWSFESSAVTSDMSLKAVWIPNYYLVKFNLNGGEGTIPDQMVTLGNLATMPTPTPEKDDHAFVSWKYNGLSWNFSTDTMTLHSTITLEAEWIDEYYTVIFNLDGDTEAIRAQKISIYNTLVTQPPKPQKEGFAFRGWAKEGGSELWNFAELPSSDMTLVAVWDKVYTVSFSTGTGTPVSPITVIDGHLVTRPDDPTSRLYDFVCWHDTLGVEWDFSTRTITEDTTLYARWADKVFRAEFDLVGGNINGNATIPPIYEDYDGLIMEPPNPEKQGFVFKGWYTEGGVAWEFWSDSPEENIVLYAKWLKKCSISFDLVGGTGTFPSEIIEEGSKLKKPTIIPQRSNYNFIGWAKMGESALWDFSTPITEDMTLVAVWELVEYKITFEAPEATYVPDIQYVQHGSLITEPEDMERSVHFMFAGWYIGDSDIKWDFTKAPTSDMTLRAHWIQISNDNDTSVDGPVVGTGGGTAGPIDPFQ